MDFFADGSSAGEFSEQGVLRGVETVAVYEMDIALEGPDSFGLDGGGRIDGGFEMEGEWPVFVGIGWLEGFFVGLGGGGCGVCGWFV